jgi:hypothetical protein
LPAGGRRLPPIGRLDGAVVVSASGQVTPRERELLALLAERDGVIEQLQARVTELEARLGQTPRNSSRPPSWEGYAKPPADRQERRAGGKRRRPGKQPGSGGAHLAQTAEPDEVVWHSPDGCSGCGADVDEAEVVAESARQVFDVPEPVVRVIEHRVLRRRCGLCHAMTAARFPDEASAPACYGPRVRALVAYFSAAHFVPVERCAQILDEAFGVQVATGSVAAIVAETATNLEPFIQRACQALGAAGVVCVDETGARIGGRLGGSTSPPTRRSLCCRRTSVAGGPAATRTVCCPPSPVWRCTTGGRPTAAMTASMRCATPTTCASCKQRPRQASSGPSTSRRRCASPTGR